MIDFKEINKFIDFFLKNNREKFQFFKKANNNEIRAFLDNFVKQLKIHFEKKAT